jgi:tetratricopeptide (TPR) repeat protein
MRSLKFSAGQVILTLGLGGVCGVVSAAEPVPPAAPAVQAVLPSTPPVPAANRYQLRQKGIRALADGIYAAAARFFLDYRDATHQSEPDFSDATVLLVKTYLLQEAPEEAAEVLDYREKNGGVLNDAYYRDALVYWRAAQQRASGEFEKAVETSNTLLGAGRTREFRRMSLELQGDAFAKLRRWNDVQTTLRSLLDEFPDKDHPLQIQLGLVKAYLAGDQVELAEKMLGLIEQNQSADPGNHLELCRILLLVRKGQIETAYQRYQKIEAVAPEKMDESWWLTSSQLAGAMMKNQHYEEALGVLVRVVKFGVTQKERTEAQLQQVECMVALKLTDAAVAAFENVRQKDAPVAIAGPVQLKLADLLRSVGQLTAAINYFQAMVDDENAPWKLRFQAAISCGWCHNEAREYEKAMLIFDQAAKLGVTKDQQAESLVLAGDAAFEMDDFTKAALYYQAVADNYGQTPAAENARFKQGQSRAKAKLYSNAAMVFKQFVEEYKNSKMMEQARLERGIALKNAGDFALAASELRSFAEEKKASAYAPRALLEASEAALGGKDVPMAIGCLTLLLDGYPKSELFPNALYQRGYTYFFEGKDAAAVKDCDRFLQLYPQLPLAADVFMWMGDHYANQALPEKGEDYWRRLVNTQPKSPLAPVALYETAKSSYHRNDLDSAVALLNQLLDGYPQASAQVSAQAEILWGDVLAEQGLFKEAVAKFNRPSQLLKEGPLVWAAQGRLGEMYYSLAGENPENLQKALQTFTELLAVEGLPPQTREKVLYRRAKVYEKLGRTDSAIKEYMDIVYSYDDALKQGKAPDWYYFARAGYDAAHLFLMNKQERLAARTYERLAAAGIPTASEARQRAREIRQAHGLNL